MTACFAQRLLVFLLVGNDVEGHFGRSENVPVRIWANGDGLVTAV